MLDTDLRQLLLATFDSVQGRERQYIIVDLTITETPGFPRETARINIGFTCANSGQLMWAISMLWRRMINGCYDDEKLEVMMRTRISAADIHHHSRTIRLFISRRH